MKCSLSKWETLVKFPYQMQEIKLHACCALEACFNHEATGTCFRAFDSCLWHCSTLDCGTLLSLHACESLPLTAPYALLPHYEFHSYCVRATGIALSTFINSGFLNHFSYPWYCRINHMEKKIMIIHSRAAKKSFFAITFTPIKKMLLYHCGVCGSPDPLKNVCFDFWSKEELSQ